ncbi:MAG TPA: glucuronoxylanase XynC [Blastocatellia bacterium]|nr:glucuronoxylanase XynC [Blastocatellia bacterium]
MKVRIALTVVGTAALLTSVAIASTGTAFVDFGSSSQTIRGFGGADAWMPQMTSAEADALFGNGNNQQIGLSILRVRIDPAGSANWGTERSNGQAAQARGAVAIATPWTPPASMKSNNNVVGGSLNTSSYGAFASYLESFVNFMQSGGVSLYAISMQNEPDARVTYESCAWTGSQMDTWVAQNSSALTTRLIMPESESFDTGFSDPALNDPNAVGHISIVGGHLYVVPPSFYTNAKNKGKEVWQTEHYLTGSGISGALALAKEIHDSMTVAQYNAYIWWWVKDWPAENFSNGLIDSNNNVKPAGYAMAQYSKFIRPGYVRSNATYNPSTNVYVSGYKGNGHFVIVALNLGSSAVSQPFKIQNATVSTFTPFQTSPSGNLVQLGTVNASNERKLYIHSAWPEHHNVRALRCRDTKLGRIEFRPIQILDIPVPRV